MAPTEYKTRHDRVGQYLHWKICNFYGKETERNWYEHHPDPVTEIGPVTILWDYTIHTDRTIKANRPDIVIKDHKQKKCLLIDMAVPADCNVSLKIFKKLSKYKDLEIEITKMWHMGTSIIPVVVGSLGVVGKDSSRLIEGIPGSPCLKEIQKIVLTSTAHTLRRALSMYFFLVSGKCHDAISNLRSLGGTRKEICKRQISK